MDKNKLERLVSQESVDKILHEFLEREVAAISERIGIQESKNINIAGKIDHTILKPEAAPDEIKTLCEEAIQYKFASVCVNPSYVPQCYEILKNSMVKVCTVIGFPLGANTTETKVFEAVQAIKNGAVEVDMVINVGMLKSGNYEYVFNDINRVVSAAKENNALSKVIIETCLLTDAEKVKACLISKEAGADFVKTSTGFSSAGANANDVALMKYVVGNSIGVKASGGIRS
ncbi:MAG: deoxyribose-phosphate aldolase, partial [Ignavibacteriaceae bacterium]|nr:deoxyribose-phosphate aldolase [Ignavibacteriaceae bacterium]